MKIDEVTKRDLEMAQAIHAILKGSEIKISPLDSGRIGKAVEWFAELGRDLGLAWQQGQRKEADNPADEKTAHGLKITQYNPGQG